MESERDLRFITTASPMARRQADGLCSCRQRRHTCKWRLMPPDLACSDALVQSRHRPFVPRPPPARCARHPAAAAALDHAQEGLQVSDNLLAVPVCVAPPPADPFPDAAQPTPPSPTDAPSSACSLRAASELKSAKRAPALERSHARGPSPPPACSRISGYSLSGGASAAMPRSSLSVFGPEGRPLKPWGFPSRKAALALHELDCSRQASSSPARRAHRGHTAGARSPFPRPGLSMSAQEQRASG